MEIRNPKRKILFVVSLIWLSAVCNRSFYHFILLVTSLCFTASLSFRRTTNFSSLFVRLLLLYLFLHVLLLIVVQIPPLTSNLSTAIISGFGLFDFFCRSDDSSLCLKPHWSSYLGFITQVFLLFFLIGYRQTGIQVQNLRNSAQVSLYFSYCLTSVSLFTWSIVFPSWSSFVWLLFCWPVLSLTSLRKYRVIIMPFIITYGSLLLIIQYFLTVPSFLDVDLVHFGFRGLKGSAAFSSLIVKSVMTACFFFVQYLDAISPAASHGYISGSAAFNGESDKRLDWWTPLLSLLACTIYICSYYTYFLIYIPWPQLSSDDWLSKQVSALGSALWFFIIFAITSTCVHMKRMDVTLTHLLYPSSSFLQAVVSYYDTILAMLVAVYSSVNISFLGIPAMTLSLILLFGSAQLRDKACCTLIIIFCLQWLSSFIVFALRLPFPKYPKDCSTFIHFDQEVAEWFGLYVSSIWPIICLVFLMFLRSVLCVDRTAWSNDISRSDAEKDISSLRKFLLVFFVHKFGVEICLILGVFLACAHNDIYGFLIMITTFLLRLVHRQTQSVYWSKYCYFVSTLLLIKYLSVLGTPDQITVCFSGFWKNWSYNLRNFLFLPTSLRSCPLIFFDYLLIVFVRLQYSIFLRSHDHAGGDNASLSLDFEEQTDVPKMYTDFTSQQGNLISYIHSGIFLFSHWITLLLILACSLEDGSIFAFGYLFSVFVLLWKGTKLYSVQPLEKSILSWRYLMYYNVIVLSLKITYSKLCCVVEDLMVPKWIDYWLGVSVSAGDCKDFGHLIPFFYDIICFALLLYQMRVLKSWYFRFVIMDYRADLILGSRGSDLLMAVRQREVRKNERAMNYNVNWIENLIEEEDKEMPESCGESPRTHEEIKRSGYYHQMSERFFPKWTENGDESTLEISQRPSVSLPPVPSIGNFGVVDELTVIEQTLEVLDTVRFTAFHVFQFINNPEWLFKISKGHAYIAHILESDKRQIKTILGKRLLLADSFAKLEALRKELVELGEFRSILSSEVLWNETLNEWKNIPPAFRFIYCLTHTVMAQSELVCFILMLVVHLSRCSLLTLPLPFMMFLWGALCIPRPPKIFWIICTAYLQFVIITRMFFHTFLYSSGYIHKIAGEDADPFSPSALFGIAPTSNTSYWDIVLLAMLFIHRYKLIRLGLWDSQNTDSSQSLWTQTDRRRRSTSREEPSWKDSISCGRYVTLLFARKASSTLDFYPWMVGCDALCLFLISMFYSQIGQAGSGNVLLDVQASRLPRWFAYTLPSAFVLMIIDRWLYLAKRVTLRIILYLFLVLLLHIVIFVFVPAITGRSVAYNAAAIALYLIKSAYLLMSAWHIRNGYPSVVSQNLLSRNYGLLRLLILKIYLNIPFLFELRTAMDWSFTSTSLAMGDFIRMENYFNEVVAQNCWIHFDHWFDNYFATRKGRPVATSGKFFKGILSVAALVIIVLAPILLFAFLNSFGTRVPPAHINVIVTIEGYPPIYQMVVPETNIHHISPSTMNNLGKILLEKSDNEIRRSALSFLAEYSFEDVFYLKFEPDSVADWTISTAGKKRLLSSLADSGDVHLKFSITVDRGLGDIRRSHKWRYSQHLNLSEVEIFANILSNGSSGNISFPLPRFLLAPPDGDLIPAKAINMALRTEDTVCEWTLVNTYWRMWIAEPMMVFVDRVVPSWLSIVVGSGGLVAMYVAVVLVVGRFVRSIVKTPMCNSLIENLPNADNILRLFQDIYVVREKKQFHLESRLYGKLIFLTRSPDTMIRWSRYKVKVKEE